MPRIPRLRKGALEASQAPDAPTEQPTQATPGDPLAGEAAGDAAAADGTPTGAAASPAPGGGETGAGETPTTSGDPLGGETPPTSGDPLGGEPPPSPTTSGDPLGGDAAPTPAASGDSPAAPPADQPTVVVPAMGETGIAMPAAGVAASPTEVAPAGDSATVVEERPVDASPGFRERARIRRRLRYLRRLRELAFRDLGGLVFDLHRFGRERPDLVAQKLDGLSTVDRELRALETALGDRRAITELREPGVAACPRCQTLHGTDANFCPGCGTALRGAVVRDAAPVSVTPAEAPAPAPPAAAEKQPDAPS
jgi:hypothetical protein